MPLASKARLKFYGKIRKAKDANAPKFLTRSLKVQRCWNPVTVWKVFRQKLASTLAQATQEAAAPESTRTKA